MNNSNYPQYTAWGQSEYVHPVNFHQVMKEQFDPTPKLGNDPPMSADIPQITTNGQQFADQIYSYDQYVSPASAQYHQHPGPFASSSPLTPVLSSDSSAVSSMTGMQSATSPAISTSSSGPHSPPINYSQSRQIANHGGMPYSYDSYTCSQLDPHMIIHPHAPYQDANGVIGSWPILEHANGSIVGQQAFCLPSPSPAKRTVYVGNLPGDASVDELLSLVKFGPIESVKILPEKSCAFISFLDPLLASAFHSDVIMRKIHLHGQELKVGWGKPTSVPLEVWNAYHTQAASRNVYIGGLDADCNEQTLRDELSSFGPIDQVKIVRDRNIGFVHFLSISVAIRAVETLSQDEEWSNKRVNYGKDRCAYVPKNQHQQQAHNLAAAHVAATYTANLGQMGATFASMNLSNTFDPHHPFAQAGNRNIYLGNLDPDTTIEEICNTIKGGVLQQIHLIPDKHICFVTFVDPNAALTFFSWAHMNGVLLRQKRIKLGWGKNPGPPSAGIAMCVQNGGSRNIYIGCIDDLDAFNEERLRRDFGQFGNLELVNILADKNCAFVNFTDITNAIKCLENLKTKFPAYTNFKIAFGKDRCGRLETSGHFWRGKRSAGNRGGRRSTSGRYNNNGSAKSSNTDQSASPVEETSQESS